MRSPHPPRGLLIPCAETELYLLLGWNLLDEPQCGFVRMIPPGDEARVNRVSINIEKMTGRSGRREPVKNIDCDARDRHKIGRAQER